MTKENEYCFIPNQFSKEQKEITIGQIQLQKLITYLFKDILHKQLFDDSNKMAGRSAAILTDKRTFN